MILLVDCAVAGIPDIHAAALTIRIGDGVVGHGTVQQRRLGIPGAGKTAALVRGDIMHNQTVVQGRRREDILIAADNIQTAAAARRAVLLKDAILDDRRGTPGRSIRRHDRTGSRWADPESDWAAEWDRAAD